METRVTGPFFSARAPTQFRGPEGPRYPAGMSIWRIQGAPEWSAKAGMGP